MAGGIERISPILPGDRVDLYGFVTRAGQPVEARSVVHKNRFGMRVFSDSDGTGGQQDFVTYGSRETTAVMALPILPRTEEVVLIAGAQYGLGRHTLEAPGARIKPGMTDIDALSSALETWGIEISSILHRGRRDETSGRQYNVTSTLETPVRSLSDQPEHLRSGNSERKVFPLATAVEMVNSGEISNGLTGLLIYQAASARGIHPHAR